MDILHSSPVTLGGGIDHANETCLSVFFFLFSFVWRWTGGRAFVEGQVVILGKGPPFVAAPALATLAVSLPLSLSLSLPSHLILPCTAFRPSYPQGPCGWAGDA
jgi:hypothetical protein